MPNYRIRKAKIVDEERIMAFYEKHSETVSNKKIREFFNGKPNIDVLLCERVCMRPDTYGQVYAACAVFYWEDLGIKYGSCNTGIVTPSKRKMGISKELYQECEKLFVENKCDKVIKLRNLDQKNMNLDRLLRLKTENWKVSVKGQMVILEKDL